MKKTVVECDRCGVTFEAIDSRPISVIYRQANIDINLFFSRMSQGYLDSGTSQIDLCPDCRRSFVQWFAFPQKIEADI